MNCHSAKELWLMIVVTKRKFFSKISTAFDQLRIITPFVIRAKILMQEVWVLETDWDEELPKDIAEKTRKCLTKFSDLRKFRSRFADACEKQQVTWLKPKPNVTIMFERSGYEDGSVSVLLVV